MEPSRYRDRREGGERLAFLLERRAYGPETLVLALPRGGVPVARCIAERLGATLDICVVRKIGLPWQSELAVGAIASGGFLRLDNAFLARSGLSTQSIEPVVEKERQELQRREKLYRGERPSPLVLGRPVVVVDDGLATGWTMQVAVEAVRALQPSAITIAAPVGAPDTCGRLARHADAVVVPLRPSPFRAVGRWYDAFPEVCDAEVLGCLR